MSDDTTLPKTQRPTVSRDGGPDRSGPTAKLERLGDFELIREIGRGGMGVVYEARQLSLDRRVALKVLPPGLGLTQEARVRFEREAHAAAKLHHTNIVPVHAIGEQDGHHFYAMELIEGKSLAAVLDEMRGGPGGSQTDETRSLGMEETDEDLAASSATDSVATTSTGRQWFDVVARLLAEVAEALDYAHARGVIHRDIKPANLLFDVDDRLCIADFGLARLTQEPGMTVSGSFLGTPAYMPPEQISGTRELDHRADIYALGVVLYEMLTLRRPFSGKTREQIVNAVVTHEPLSPRRIDRKIPVDLETVCLKAIEKDPARRYASAGEMANDLRLYLAHGLITARRAGPIRRTVKLVRRRPVASTVALAAVLLVIAAGAIWWTMEESKKEEIRRLVAEAQFLLEQGDSESALAVADKTLAGDPQSIEARTVRARALMGLWRWEEAVEEARVLLSNDPTDRAAHLVMVWATLDDAQQRGDIDVGHHLEMLAKGPPESPDTLYAKAALVGSAQEKLDFLDRALEREPDHVLALRARESVHRSRKDFAAALSDAERFQVAAGKHEIVGRTTIEQLYRFRHDYQKVLEHSNRTVQLYPDGAYAHGFRGFAFAALGHFEEAAESFTRSIEAQPLGPAYWLRGAYYYQIGDYEKAASDFRKSVELKPDSASGYLNLARAYLTLGMPSDARTVVERLEEESRSWSNREVKANAALFLPAAFAELGDREGALRCAGEIESLDPGGLQAPLARAAIGRRFDGLGAAASDCVRFAELPPDDFVYVGYVLDGLLQRGSALRDRCQLYDLAHADHDRAIEQAPWWPDPYRERAITYRLQGDLEAAAAALDKAIELQPRWPNLYHDRGRVYLEQERFGAALKEFEQFLSFDAESDDLRRDQVTALLRLGRVDEAIGILRDGVERRPRADWLQNWLGEVFLRLGRVNEAVAAHDAAVDSQPTQANGYARRAVARLLARASCAEVREDLEKALELAPYASLGPRSIDAAPGEAEMEIVSRVAWAQAAYGHARCPGALEPSRVVELARRAVAYDPRRADYQLALGMALHRAGSHDEAREAFQRSLDLRPRDDAFTLFGLAMTQDALGNAAAAQETVERALSRARDTYPNHPGFALFKR
jgi:serine/threonine protein kinase/Flp pilus assembly protein TadD